ncbi:PhnD/SsuA/transferrin family substrate-binding protein [Piscinibacter aquaticus]|uniref:PhnD/SsuA/transferrin family substrate-binding protein n=1 Tax=Piscinibacter aquaticus TaxID=392597 RepID=A0A5C6U1X8_9BURK|nr:PhnD/SsuA/transferrin family substrate-binding protein [Piscinibacter aquaticus]
MDGVELCRRLRAEPSLSGLPLLALSANAMPSETRRAMQAGFDAYLTKPLDVVRLLEEVDRRGARGAGPGRRERPMTLPHDARRRRGGGRTGRAAAVGRPRCAGPGQRAADDHAGAVSLAGLAAGCLPPAARAPRAHARAASGHADDQGLPHAVRQRPPAAAGCGDAARPLARLAIADWGHRPLAATIDSLEVLVLVRRDSPAHAPADLRGGTVAMLDPLALTATVGRQWLQEQGLLGAVTVQTTPSINSALYALDRGDAQAIVAGRTQLLGLSVTTPRNDRVLATLRGIPGPIYVARPGLATAEFDALQAAMWAFRHDTTRQVTAANSSLHSVSPALLEQLEPLAAIARRTLAGGNWAAPQPGSGGMADTLRAARASRCGARRRKFSRHAGGKVEAACCIQAEARSAILSASSRSRCHSAAHSGAAMRGNHSMPITPSSTACQAVRAISPASSSRPASRSAATRRPCSASHRPRAPCSRAEAAVMASSGRMAAGAQPGWAMHSIAARSGKSSMATISSSTSCAGSGSPAPSSAARTRGRSGPCRSGRCASARQGLQRQVAAAEFEVQRSTARQRRHVVAQLPLRAQRDGALQVPQRRTGFAAAAAHDRSADQRVQPRVRVHAVAVGIGDRLGLPAQRARRVTLLEGAHRQRRRDAERPARTAAPAGDLDGLFEAAVALGVATQRAEDHAEGVQQLEVRVCQIEPCRARLDLCEPPQRRLGMAHGAGEFAALPVERGQHPQQFDLDVRDVRAPRQGSALGGLAASLGVVTLLDQQHAVQAGGGGALAVVLGQRVELVGPLLDAFVDAPLAARFGGAEVGLEGLAAAPGGAQDVAGAPVQVARLLVAPQLARAAPRPAAVPRRAASRAQPASARPRAPARPRALPAVATAACSGRATASGTEASAASATRSWVKAASRSTCAASSSPQASARSITGRPSTAAASAEFRSCPATAAQRAGATPPG